MLAQYIPAKVGVPIGLAAVALSVWQLGLGGWPLWLGIALLVLVIWRLVTHRGLFEKDKEKEAHRNSKLFQAQKIQDEIMSLLSQLDKEESKLSETGKWKDEPIIKDILSKLQSNLNKLGYIIKNTQFDRWAEQMMQMYSQMMAFHVKDSDSLYDEWGWARINSKFRYFINKIKGVNK